MQKYGRPSPKSLMDSTPYQNSAKEQILATDILGDLSRPLEYDETSIWQVLTQVQDPEIPTVSIVDLGIIRSVSLSLRQIFVEVTPTYSGCPATDLINDLILEALCHAGYQNIKIEQVLSPAWTSDFITSTGRKKLIDAGIAPPKGLVSKSSLIDREITCPHCNSENTRLISEFGSTACKALYQCNDCREAFDYFKCI